MSDENIEWEMQVNEEIGKLRERQETIMSVLKKHLELDIDLPSNPEDYYHQTKEQIKQLGAGGNRSLDECYGTRNGLRPENQEPTTDAKELIAEFINDLNNIFDLNAPDTLIEKWQKRLEEQEK